jgi:hypothetical protein
LEIDKLSISKSDSPTIVWYKFGVIDYKCSKIGMNLFNNLIYAPWVNIQAWKQWLPVRAFHKKKSG